MDPHGKVVKSRTVALDENNTLLLLQAEGEENVHAFYLDAEQRQTLLNGLISKPKLVLSLPKTAGMSVLGY